MLIRGGIVAVLGLMLCCSMALAQDQGGGQGGGRRGGNFDPAQMRERFMNGIKEQLGATDDEWKVLQPKIEKVQSLQRNTRGGGFMGFGGRGGPGGDRNRGGDQEESAVARASRELRAVLEDKGAPVDDIVRKLTALREAREKARNELLAAQKDLKEVLTPRQEAVLVTMGMLD